VDAARGRHARWQESHIQVAVICVAIVADLVGRCTLEDVVLVVGVDELALSQPIVTCAFEIVANCDDRDVHQQIGLLCHADDADFEIAAAVALTREHQLVSGGETRVVTNEIQRPQDMVVRACPIRSMMEAGVDVVPGTVTTHEVLITEAWHVWKRSEGRVVGASEELMEEGNLVLLCLVSEGPDGPCMDDRLPKCVAQPSLLLMMKLSCICMRGCGRTQLQHYENG
jgi:hypothetical protein